jgi:hypothetical protein
MPALSPSRWSNRMEHPLAQMKIAAGRCLARRCFIGEKNGRTRSVDRYVLLTALQGSVSTAIPRESPAASAPHDVSQAIRPITTITAPSRRARAGKSSRPRSLRHSSQTTMRRSRSELSPRNARAGAHRINQAGPLVWGRVREDHPHEQDRRRQQQRQCLNGSHGPPSLDCVSMTSSLPAPRWRRTRSPGPSAWTLAPAVAVVAHGQRPPKSHATTGGPAGTTKPAVEPVRPTR